MDYNKLSKGNYVYCTTLHQVVSVEYISKHTIEIEHNGESVTVGHASIRAIVPTQHWMLSLGFKQHQSGYYYKDTTYRFALINGKLHISIGDNTLGWLIQLVGSISHLQNLYYALTNEELFLQLLQEKQYICQN